MIYEKYNIVNKWKKNKEFEMDIYFKLYINEKYVWFKYSVIYYWKDEWNYVLFIIFFVKLKVLFEFINNKWLLGVFFVYFFFELRMFIFIFW